jgi:hypothetical protein
MISYNRTLRTISNLAFSWSFLRCYLIVPVLVLSAWSCHAQYSTAIFDTLDVRHDLSKSAIVRFQAAQSHATACMYGGRAEDQRSTALLMLDLATELGQDTLHARAYTVVGCS